ncbi:MAG: ATP-binding cassette domain-containing protein [Peptococcaceae bacterium]|nr:ATP-binding cassette domain-containing protein [Peptococcaceae bacterium]
MRNIIETNKLSLKAGTKYLLKDIDWKVRPGENWIVFGMNGCGKTTLLSILAGYRQASSGTFTILGERYTPENILLLRRKIGWVSSSFFDQKYTKESALDIVLSGCNGSLGRDNAYHHDEVLMRAKQLLKAFHIGDKIYQPFHLLSRGERENVLIARALIGRPEILLLDEPCTGLDICAREYLLNTLRGLASNSNLTIIYVTHYTEEIMMDVFAKTLLMKNGLVYQQGLTEEMFTSEVFTDFLELPTVVARRTYRGLEATVEYSADIAKFAHVKR